MKIITAHLGAQRLVCFLATFCVSLDVPSCFFLQTIPKMIELYQSGLCLGLLSFLLFILSFFFVLDDPTERTDLSGDPDQEGRVLLMKKEILNHLKGYVAPPNVSLEHWTKQAENSMVAGAWTPGWCNELDLSI